MQAMEHGGERYAEDAIGWVVKATEAVPDGSYWQGPDHGDGTTVGPLRTAMYWPNLKTVYFALKLAFGSVPVATAAGLVPEKIGAELDQEPARVHSRR